MKKYEVDKLIRDRKKKRKQQRNMRKARVEQKHQSLQREKLDAL